MDPVALLPYLQCHALVSLADVDYICNPHWTVVNRTLRILECVSSRGPDALKRFVQCLSESTENVGHAYLAGRLHKAMKERWYEAHMDIEMIDQVDIGNKHCALQNVTRPAISMQQAHWQYKLRKSRNAVRDRRFGTVVMEFPFNSSTRTRQAKRSTISSVQPHLLLEPIDQQLLSFVKGSTPSSHGMGGIVMNVPVTSSIQEGNVPVTSSIQEGNVPVTASIQEGNVPVTSSIQEGNVPVTSSIQEGNVPVTSSIQEGNVPVTSSIQEGNVPVTSSIQEGNVPVTSSIQEGNVPVTSSIQEGNVPVTSSIQEGELKKSTYKLIH